MKRIVIISVVLLLLGLLFSFVYLIKVDGGMTVLTHYHNNIKLKTKKITTNRDFAFTFSPTNDYLGIIAIKFNKESLTGKKGDLIINISNVNSGKLLYTQNYSIESLYGLPTYPFGFTPLADSKGSIYLVELTLANTQSDTAIKVDSEPPFFISKYKLSIKYILSSLPVLLHFLMDKTTYFFGHPELKISFFSFLLPFIFYISIQIIKNIAVSKNTIDFIRLESKSIISTYAILTLLLILVQVLLGISNLYYYLFTLLTWMLFLTIYEKGSNTSLLLSLFFIVLTPCYLAMKMEAYAELFAAWGYVFFTVGTAHVFMEYYLPQFLHKPYYRFLSVVKSYFNKSTIFTSLLKGMLFYDALPKLIKLLKRIYSFVITLFLGDLRERSNIFKYIVRLIITASVLMLIFIVAIKTFYNIRRELTSRERNRTRISLIPVIQSVEPWIVYKGTKVVIYGSSFTKNSDDKWKLYVNGKEARVDQWEDNKIIFTIPLTWNSGYLYLQVEKNLHWDDDYEIVKSNIRSIRLLQITSSFDIDDEEYFNQLEKLHNEVLELNGYN